MFGLAQKYLSHDICRDKLGKTENPLFHAHAVLLDVLDLTNV